MKHDLSQKGVREAFAALEDLPFEEKEIAEQSLLSELVNALAESMTDQGIKVKQTAILNKDGVAVRYYE